MSGCGEVMSDVVKRLERIEAQIARLEAALVPAAPVRLLEVAAVPDTTNVVMSSAPAVSRVSFRELHTRAKQADVAKASHAAGTLVCRTCGTKPVRRAGKPWCIACRCEVVP